MTDWQSIDNSLLDPSWYAQGDIVNHQAFSVLRAEDPVRKVEVSSYGRPFWAVSRYDGVREVLDRWQDFSSRGASRMPRDPKRRTPEERHQLGYDVRIQSVDPPLHQLYRRPINKHFSVPAIARMTDSVGQICDDIIAEVAGKKDFDLIDDVAAEVPMRVVMQLLGVPREDWDYVKLCTMRYGLAADPRYTIDNDPIETAKKGAHDLDDYTVEMAKKRRAEPQDDLATIISNLRIDDDELSIHEMRGWFSLLILGGLETTRNLIGTMIWKLLEMPDQRQLLLDNPALMPQAIEEGMRWGSPVRSLIRIVNDDMEFQGKYFRQGDWVLTLMVSANRDEDIWNNADVFDIQREEIEHTALGHGIHKCLGRSLLRLEMREILPRILTAFPDMTLTGDPAWQADIALNGFVKAPMNTGELVRV